MNGTVLVVGIGLIGGSLSLAIKKKNPHVLVIGYDVNQENALSAKNLGIIDIISSDLENEMKQADLIILATPVEQTEQVMDKMADWGDSISALVTDTGSTKTGIMTKAKKLQENGITFIGGHPMAGSHKSGPASAKAHIFENAFYMLSPLPDVSPDKVTELKIWLEGTNAKFLVVSPEEHDYLTGVVSHFPHLIAASLVRLTEKHSKNHGLIQTLAAGGFRDITRIASSSPGMWRDITKQNRGQLLQLLNEWREEMGEIEVLLNQADDAELLAYFSGAKTFRDGLPPKNQGAIVSYYDLYVDVIDTVGVISQITQILALKNLSLTNIRILETREDIYGVLRLSFQSETDRIQASECLKEQGYTTYLAD